MAFTYSWGSSNIWLPLISLTCRLSLTTSIRIIFSVNVIFLSVHMTEFSSSGFSLSPIQRYFGSDSVPDYSISNRSFLPPITFHHGTLDNAPPERDSDPATLQLELEPTILTQEGSQTHSLFIEAMQPVSGLTEAQMEEKELSEKQPDRQRTNLLAQDACERYKQAGKGVHPWEQRGLHFYNQRTPSSFWVDIKAYISSSSFDPIWFNWDWHQFSSVQSLSRVQLFATPWTAAHQASLSITNSRSLPKLMSIEWAMPSNHLILCHPLLLSLSIFPSIRVFSNEPALLMRWPKYWSFSFSISPSCEHPGLISFRMDWLDLLAVQRILKSLLQHHSSKASILWCSAFFIVQLSHPGMTISQRLD